MALLSMESFDLGYMPVNWYTTYGLSGTKRTGINGLSVGFFGRNELRFSGRDEIYTGFALIAPVTNDTGYGQEFLALYGNNGTEAHIYVKINPITRTVEALRGSTVLATAASPAIVANVWRYIEVHAKLSDTVGILQVWVDEQLVIDFSGDTKNGGVATTFDKIGLGYQQYYGGTMDDFYLLDTTGTTNNNRLGDIDVIALRPNGNGSSTQLTGSDGDQVNNYLLVDDPTTPSITDYTAGSTAGLRDLYALEDVPTNTAVVRGVKVSYDARKAAAGYAAAKPVLKANGVATNEAAQPLSTSETQYASAIYETDPSGAAWTIPNLNSAEAGIETA